MSRQRYLFISAPADLTKTETAKKTKDKLGESAELFNVNLPDFKVGTLDSLYILSDELIKHDASMEAITWKIGDFFKVLLQNDLNLWKNSLAVGDRSMDQYLKSFQWNTMKYRVDKSLREITDVIIQEVNSIDTLMKTKIQSYTQMRSQLQGLQRKQNGNLAVRAINDVVKKEYFVLDSEYLTTILVAVPKMFEKEWLASYESLTQMVVPRCAQKIAEDDEYFLYTTTLFQRVVAEFTAKARENKFVVRDFQWDEELMKRDKKELQDAGASEKEQSTTLQRLCKTNFGEVFACWIHIKAFRVFVESILRHGLPPNCQAMMIKVKQKQERKVSDILASHFAHLDGGRENNSKDEEPIEENLAVLMGEKDYSAYVCFPIELPN